LRKTKKAKESGSLSSGMQRIRKKRKNLGWKQAERSKEKEKLGPLASTTSFLAVVYTGEDRREASNWEGNPEEL